jgi:hypothetical protein
MISPTLSILLEQKSSKTEHTMDTTRANSRAKKLQAETITYAGFHSIITGVSRSWEYGGFPLHDGTFWRYREPDAVIVVEGERMRATAKLSRANDQVQILDNAKNMFFSTRRFEIPDQGHIAFEWDMKALCSGTRPHDWYDGFVSVTLRLGR